MASFAIFHPLSSILVLPRPSILVFVTAYFTVFNFNSGFSSSSKSLNRTSVGPPE